MVVFISSDLIDEFDTSESLNKDIYVFKDNIIIPYISLEVVEDIDFLQLQKKDKIDFSYLIFKGLKTIESTINNLKMDFSNSKESNVNYITYNNVFSEKEGDELKVEFKNMYLCLPSDFKIKKGILDKWSINNSTSNFDLDKNIAVDFFTKDKIPNEILELINLRDSSKLKTLDNLFGKEH